MLGSVGCPCLKIRTTPAVPLPGSQLAPGAAAPPSICAVYGSGKACPSSTSPYGYGPGACAGDTSCLPCFPLWCCRTSAGPGTNWGERGAELSALLLLLLGALLQGTDHALAWLAPGFLHGRRQEPREAAPREMSKGQFLSPRACGLSGDGRAQLGPAPSSLCPAGPWQCRLAWLRACGICRSWSNLEAGRVTH